MKAWLLAARPPTLLAAMAPVIVGGGLAASDGVFRWDAFLVTFGAAVLINLAANFANDASDAVRGADDERIGPPRAVSTGLISARAMWTAVAVAIGLAALLGVYLAIISSWVILAVGVISIIALLGYTGGPWPYGYHGLGELFVFVFFGLIAVVGSRFVHDATAPADAWWLAIPVGFLVTAILVANNVRDIDTDRRAGKRTLAVILGRSGTRWLYVGLVLGAFVAIGLSVVTGATPRGALLGLAGIPLALGPIRAVSTQTAPAPLIAALKATARLHLAVGVLVAIGVQL